MTREPSGPMFEGEFSPERRRQILNTLANLALFERASGATVERILETAYFTSHRPNEIVYREGDPASTAFFLLEGTVRVFQSAAGQTEYTPKIFSATTHFGDLAGLARLGTYRSSIQAMVDSVTARLPFSILEQMLESDHGLCLSWLYSVARQHGVTIDSDRQNVFGGVFARFANILISYGDVFGTPCDGMTAIDYPLSYAKLSQQVGCTRRTAISTMQNMTEKGLVRSTADGCWQIDAPRLRELLIPGRLSLAYSISAEEPEVEETDEE